MTRASVFLLGLLSLTMASAARAEDEAIVAFQIPLSNSTKLSDAEKALLGKLNDGKAVSRKEISALWAKHFLDDYNSRVEKGDALTARAVEDRLVEIVAPKFASLGEAMVGSNQKLEKLLGRKLVNNDSSENPLNVGFKGRLNCYSGSVWQFLRFFHEKQDVLTAENLVFLFSTGDKDIAHVQLGYVDSKGNVFAIEATKEKADAISLGKISALHAAERPVRLVSAIEYALYDTFRKHMTADELKLVEEQLVWGTPAKLGLRVALNEAKVRARQKELSKGGEASKGISATMLSFGKTSADKEDRARGIGGGEPRVVVVPKKKADPAEAKKLFDGLAEKQDFLRAPGAAELYRMSQEDPETVLKVLLDEVKTPNKKTANTALYFVAIMRNDARSAVPRLKELLKHKEPAVYWAALRALASIGTKAEILDQLMYALADERPEIASPVSESLGTMGKEDPKTIVPILLAAVKKKENAEEFRFYALTAIEKIGPKARSLAQDDVIALLGEKETKLRYRSLDTLASMGLDESKDADVMPKVIKLLEDEEMFVRSAATGLCKKLGARAKSAIPQLVKLLDDKKYAPNRYGAVSALEAMGPEASSALPRLRELTKDRDIGYRVQEAIKKIEGK